ncbi:helix-turn-helix transcriptional regulator [Shewanella sp. AS16]|uniref:AraC family transcriptional regulator n=1 Tax=Shewanella sp. AS16 TaxID=2907625 RepID=UPI001F1DBA7D|nr:helix-turn-helix transcriptional regulator [Shewanella sp. AS16]MCE9687578.1 helix-turn-helix transcriptional regulator [Shewanella sp. AS16]
MANIYRPTPSSQAPEADVFFSHRLFSPNTTVPMHSHAWGQLQLVSGGILELDVEGKRYLSPSQYALWVPAGVVHESFMRRSINYYSMNIVPELARSMPAETCLLTVSPIMHAIIADLRQRGVTVPQTPEDKNLVRVLLDQLAGASVSRAFLPSSTDKLLQPILAALEAAPTDNKSFGQWALELHTTERTLARRCRQLLGMSFTELRQRHKFIYSLQLLRQGESIKQIALSLGYNQTSPYISMFKKYAQCPPEQYRRRLS